MHRLRRSLIILGVSITITLVALAIRTLNAAGVFTDVTPGFGGHCRALTGIDGANGMDVDRPDRLLFISATDKRAFAAGKPNSRDGLYVLSLNHPEKGFQKLRAPSDDFHPRALSLFRVADEKSFTLMAINKPTKGEPSIDVFDATAVNGQVALKEVANIGGGLLVDPEDIAAAGPYQFYVTNGWTTTNVIGRTLEFYAMVPRANIVFFDGNSFRVAMDDLTYAKGVRLSPDGARLYVTTVSGRAIYAYDRNPFTGDLKEAGKLSIPSGLSKLAIDGQGDLWIAANPKLFALLGFRANPSKPSPSEVYEVSLKNGIPDEARLVYANLGDQLGGASTVAATGGQLFIGSSFDSKVLDCQLPGSQP